MQEVMGVLLETTTLAQVWYKLYADDLVLLVTHRHLPRLLHQLRRTITEFGLLLNEAKSVIFAMKGHRKLGSGRTLDGIPVVDENCYLGVLIDSSGSIDPHLTKLL